MAGLKTSCIILLAILFFLDGLIIWLTLKEVAICITISEIQLRILNMHKPNLSFEEKIDTVWIFVVYSDSCGCSENISLLLYDCFQRVWPFWV